MPERFDASGPVTPPDGGRGSDQRALTSMMASVAQRELFAMLGRIDELVAEHEEQVAAEDLDPEIIQTLTIITGREDAPLSYRSLHRRVKAGFITWKQFWLAPEEEADGLRLVHEVMREQTRTLLERMRGLTDEQARREWGVDEDA